MKNHLVFLPVKHNSLITHCLFIYFDNLLIIMSKILCWPRLSIFLCFEFSKFYIKLTCYVHFITKSKSNRAQLSKTYQSKWHLIWQLYDLSLFYHQYIDWNDLKWWFICERLDACKDDRDKLMKTYQSFELYWKGFTEILLTNITLDIMYTLFCYLIIFLLLYKHREP